MEQLGQVVEPINWTSDISSEEFERMITEEVVIGSNVNRIRPSVMHVLFTFVAFKMASKEVQGP